MPEFGFPAQYRQANLRSLIASMKDRSDDARVSAVTERFADVTSELDGRVNELMQIEKSLTDLRAYGEAITLSEARSRVMQDALEDIRESGQEITDTATILQTNGTDLDLAGVSNQARGELETMIAQLNISFGGRSLFAGDDAGATTMISAEEIMTLATPFLEGAVTSSAAYAAIEAEFMNAGGLYDTAFYTGGSGNAPRTEIAPGEVVDYTVRANEDPVRRMLLNTVVAAAAFDLSNGIPSFQRRDLLAQASNELRSAVVETTSVQARLGASEARIATVKARNAATDASLTLAFNELAGADAYDAAITLTQLESQLEVAFATTSRLASLSLANFR